MAQQAIFPLSHLSKWWFITCWICDLQPFYNSDSL